MVRTKQISLATVILVRHQLIHLPVVLLDSSINKALCIWSQMPMQRVCWNINQSFRSLNDQYSGADADFGFVLSEKHYPQMQPTDTALVRRMVCLFTHSSKLVLFLPIYRGVARLSWLGWLVTFPGGLPVLKRSPIPVGPTNRAQHRALSLMWPMSFHRLTRSAHLYNGCLPWHKVVLNSRVHSSVKYVYVKPLCGVG